MIQHERNEQIALFHWIRLNDRMYPELALAFAIPNGGSRHKAEARYLRAAGVRAGIPDICIPVSRHGYHALWIEMKHGRNKPSADQRKVIESLKDYGGYVEVCYSCQDAIDIISWYLSIGGNHAKRNV